MKNLLCIALLLISTLGIGQDQPVETPQIGISIPLGETVLVGDILIGFEEVLEDSRCPTDVTCIWAGQAKIKLALSKNDSETTPMELLFGANSDLTISDLDDIIINAMALTPYPTSATKGKMEYVLLVRKFPKTKN